MTSPRRSGARAAVVLVDVVVVGGAVALLALAIEALPVSVVAVGLALGGVVLAVLASLAAHRAVSRGPGEWFAAAAIALVVATGLGVGGYDVVEDAAPFTDPLEATRVRATTVAAPAPLARTFPAIAGPDCRPPTLVVGSTLDGDVPVEKLECPVPGTADAVVLVRWPRVSDAGDAVVATLVNRPAVGYAAWAAGGTMVQWAGDGICHTVAGYRDAPYSLDVTAPDCGESSRLLGALPLPAPGALDLVGVFPAAAAPGCDPGVAVVERVGRRAVRTTACPAGTVTVFWSRWADEEDVRIQRRALEGDKTRDRRWADARGELPGFWDLAPIAGGRCRGTATIDGLPYTIDVEAPTCDDATAVFRGLPLPAL